MTTTTNNEIELLKTESLATYQQVSQYIEIKTVEQFAYAGDALSLLNKKIKAIEDKRVEYTKPLLETQRKIKKDFDDLKKPLEELTDKIKTAMMSWKREDDERKRKLQEHLDQEAERLKEKNDIEFDTPQVELTQKVQGTESTSFFRKTWTYEIVNPIDVPKEYWCIDEKKISEFIKEGGRELAGVRIYQQETIQSRSK